MYLLPATEESTILLVFVHAKSMCKLGSVYLLQGNQQGSHLAHTTCGTKLDTEAVQDVEMVQVLAADSSEVKYTMYDPRVRQNACTCDTATQGNICAHQIAWILKEYPYGATAGKLLVKMLGSTFGYFGACSLLDISALIDAFHELEIASIASCSGRSSSLASDKAQAEDVHPLPVLNPAPAATTHMRASVPGSVALHNHKEKLCCMLQSMLSLLDTTPADNLASIMQTQTEQMSVLVKVSEKAASGEPLATTEHFEKKCDINIRRHKSFLDRASAAKKKSASDNLAGTAVLQPNTASTDAQPRPDAQGQDLLSAMSSQAGALANASLQQQNFRAEAKKKDKDDTIKKARKQSMQKAAIAMQQELQKPVAKRLVQQATPGNPSLSMQTGKNLRQERMPKMTCQPEHDPRTFMCSTAPQNLVDDIRGSAAGMNTLAPWSCAALASAATPAGIPGSFHTSAGTSACMPQGGLQVNSQPLYPLDLNSKLFHVGSQARPVHVHSSHPYTGCPPQHTLPIHGGHDPVLEYLLQHSQRNRHSLFDA
jgi:hypothetical protein